MSFAAFPGGQIFIDDQLVGRDTTQVLVLKPGSHNVRIVNRFLGEHTSTIDISDGETGLIKIKW